VARVDGPMRLVSALILVAALAGCDDAAPAATLEAGGDRPQVTAEKVEAERACAELTGYQPGAVTTDAAGTEALRLKDFRACVATVIGGEPAAPELRGRANPGG